MIKVLTRSPLVIVLSFLGLNLASLSVVVLVVSFYPEVSPFMIFIPSVLLVTWFAGFPLGITTIGISMLGVWLLMLYPVNNPLLERDPQFFIEMFLFFAVAIYSSFVLDRSKNQKEIIQVQKKLRQNRYLIETLEKNYENAQKEIKARDQFLAIASHELKTPVTSMLLQVQTAIHNIRNVSLANFSVANLLKMLEGTEQQSQRLSKMVNDLLNLSLITTGRLDLEPEQTDLSDITKHVADNFADKMQRDNNAIIVHADKPVIGMWDKVRIAQAVTNLISNAIKYGDNKPIDVSVSNSGGHAKLVVKDHGIGIPQSEQKRIFERFERAVTSREFQGLGVGLYITNQIVRAHNGKIQVESKPNNGTSFIVELPLKIAK
jgi:signal transduction histidine kinase